MISKDIMGDHSLDLAMSRLEESVKQHPKRHQPLITNRRSGLSILTNDITATLDWNIDSNICLEAFADPDPFAHLSGEYIGSLVLNLISKMEMEDSSVNIGPDAGCVTMQCLVFALDMYASMPKSNAFSLEVQQNLHCRLLNIICGCISTTFSKREMYDQIDLSGVVKRMLSTASTCFFPIIEQLSLIVKEHLQGLCLLVTICLQKSVQMADPKLLDKLNEVIESQFEFLVIVLVTLYNTSSTKTLPLLLKVIQSLRTCSPIEMQSKRRSSVRKRSNILAATFKQQHHLHQSHQLGCTLERVVLRVAERLISPTQLRLVFRHFQINIQCCCNTDLNQLVVLLITSQQTSTHKQCLQFIRHNILRTTFSSTIPCDTCEGRRSEFIAGPLFYQMYAETTSTAEVPAMLKHVAKIAKLLPFDMSYRIMIEVLLPPFRREKRRLAEDAASHEIVSLCLNAFLCYLRDIRLIKGFFNDENIQHLSDLLGMPEFASLVCCLLKIGLENETFLGENCGEQLVLSGKLHDMRTRSVRMVSEVMSRLFKIMDAKEGGRMQLRCFDVDVPEDTNSMILQLQVGQLSALNVLQLAVIYWNMMLQMLRTRSEGDSPNNTSTITLSVREQESIMCIVQNALSCFLYTRPAVDNDEISFESMHFVWVTMDELVDNAEAVAIASDHVPTVMLICEPHTNVVLMQSDIYESAKNYTYLSDFSSNLGASDPDLIFDVRLSKSDTQIPCVDTVSNIYTPIDCKQVSVIDQAMLQKRVGDTQQMEKTPSAVQNVLQFLNEKFLEVLFPTVSVDSDYNGNKDDVSEELRTFGNAINVTQIVESPEHKKLFLQLFEITCGVWMSAVRQQSTIAERETLGGE